MIGDLVKLWRHIHIYHPFPYPQTIVEHGSVDLSSHRRHVVYSYSPNQPIIPKSITLSITHEFFPRDYTTSNHAPNSPLKSTHVERLLARSWPIFRRATLTGTEKRRPIVRTITITTKQRRRRATGWGNVRPTCDGAGRTFVQDGFDARTGDERQPREQPGKRESGDSTSSESERSPGGR